MTSPVTEIFRAALGPDPRRVLLLDPGPHQAGDLATSGGTIVQVRPTARGARRLSSPARLEDATVMALCADREALPFADGTFGAVACCAGVSDDMPLDGLRRLLEVGGVLAVASRVREGVAGGAASLVRRAARSGALPRASDLTARMLRAGMRPVRQATAKRAVVPTVVTWAEVRARPWDDPPPAGGLGAPE